MATWAAIVAVGCVPLTEGVATPGPGSVVPSVKSSVTPKPSEVPPAATATSTIEATPTAPPFKLIRGYISALTPFPRDMPGGGVGDALIGKTTLGHNVYLPDVSVFLREINTGDEGEPVQTDLSGRFTLSAESQATYQICWSRKGFLDGCAEGAISVSDAHIHIGTVNIAPARIDRSTVVFGKVSLKDGSTPRLLLPMANLNVFAQVELLDENDVAVDKVIVNNFGEYLLPAVPSLVPITLQASVEDAIVVQAIPPEAYLGHSDFNYVNLVIDNTPPRLDPLIPLDPSGGRLRTANVGEKISLVASARDKDGDDLGFHWMLPDGSGKLEGFNDTTVTWVIPENPGRYQIILLAYDRRGGYDRMPLSIEANEPGDGGIPFSGMVSGTDVDAIEGATVDVNGEITHTNKAGYFRLRVPDADRFVLNINKRETPENGGSYASISRVYDDSVAAGNWTMARATTISVKADPNKPISVKDVRSPLNCPGLLSSKLAWDKFPSLTRPVWQDGKGNVIHPPTDVSDVDRLLPFRIQPFKGRSELDGRDCGPGVSVEFPPGSIDYSSIAPGSKINISVSTIDLMSPEQMPGDYTVAIASGGTGVMQSYGAGTVEIWSGNTDLKLRSGATATISLPVDPSHLESTAILPTEIPLLSYDSKAGVWTQDGIATLVGGDRYVGKVEHFSAINADLIKTDQSCIRILSPELPPTYQLEVMIPMTGGAPPKVLTKTITNSAPSEHVLYNLPSNVNVVLVPVRTDPGPLIGAVESAPIGLFVVNTGDPQPADISNLPPGPPYEACNSEVHLFEQIIPSTPKTGEFLRGIFNFEATNLSELVNLDNSNFDPDSNNSVLANSLLQAAEDYYSQIDPRDKRTTLKGFREANKFDGSPGEIHVVFANSGDLGYGRDLHCKRTGEDVACYVTKYGSIGTPDLADVNEAIEGKASYSTVAMEFSRIEDPLGSPTEFSDPDRVVKFYVYKGSDIVGDSSTRLGSADLDDLGERPIPQLCMVCHGGAYPGGPVAAAGVPSFASRDDVKLGASFVPLDLSEYTFSSVVPYDKLSQQADFKIINEELVAHTAPGNAELQEIISLMYASGADCAVSHCQDENLVPLGWGPTQPIKATTYRDMISSTCRTCHITNAWVDPDGVNSLRLHEFKQLQEILGKTESRVCIDHVMPHARVTHDIFWTRTDPSYMPGLFQIFGDSFGVGTNASFGWNGEICGEYTKSDSTLEGDKPASAYDEIQEIFTENGCSGCHSGSSPNGGLNLGQGVSYGNLINVPSTQEPGLMRVNPDNPDDSYLIHKLEGPDNGTMLMPLGASEPLWDVIDKIRAWIENGAPE